MIFFAIKLANNYASSLVNLKHFEEAKSLLRKMVPMARRVLEEGNELTLRMQWSYGRALYKDPAATLNDLREAVTTLEDAERIARRVLGGTHPTTRWIRYDLRHTRAAVCARETQPSRGA